MRCPGKNDNGVEMKDMQNARSHLKGRNIRIG